jgi:hypothetical protein
MVIIQIEGLTALTVSSVTKQTNSVALVQHDKLRQNFIVEFIIKSIYIVCVLYNSVLNKMCFQYVMLSDR